MDIKGPPLFFFSALFLFFFPFFRSFLPLFREIGHPAIGIFASVKSPLDYSISTLDRPADYVIAGEGEQRENQPRPFHANGQRP